MESPTMIKRRLFLVVAVCLAFCAIAVGVVMLCHLMPKAHHDTSDMKRIKPVKSRRGSQIYWGEGSIDGRPYSCAYKVVQPHWKPITTEQSNEFSRVFKSILNAYQCGDISGMKSSMMETPNFVTNMPEQLFYDFVQPVLHEQEAAFVHPKELRSFSSAEEFVDYCRINIDLALFLGGLFMKRDWFGCGAVIRCEGDVFAQLQRWKDKFHREGQEDLERAADGFIAEWIEHIESPDSFTRQYLWFEVDLQWPCYNDGLWTIEQLSAFVKDKAKILTRSGYTPKWLSEFDDLSGTVK